VAGFGFLMLRFLKNSCVAFSTGVSFWNPFSRTKKGTPIDSTMNCIEKGIVSNRQISLAGEF
jgi:hypothetical protein